MKSMPESWLADYERDGYVVVPDCVDAATLTKLKAGVDDITHDPDSLPKWLQRHLDYERNFLERRPDMSEIDRTAVGNALRNIMELPLFNPVFAQLVAYEPLLDVLETLFGTSEFAFHNYKCIIKAPKISSRFQWHRDLPYLQHTSPNAITAMLCLDEMTEANGATVVFPGTHRVPHESVKPSDIDIAEKNLPTSKRVTVTCPAGSAVLFHVNIVHGGGANRSDTPRRNAIGIWTGPDTYPTYANRYAYQGVMPRSRDPHRQKQMSMTFAPLFENADKRFTLTGGI